MNTLRFSFVFMGLSLLGASFAHAADDRIPDDVVAKETETCLAQATKNPAWFGPVYCPCVMKETQKNVSYTDYQAVNKELQSPTGARPALEKNKDVMESIAKTCMVIVQKRLLEEKNLGGDTLGGAGAPQ
jgi:hypothetical protein